MSKKRYIPMTEETKTEEVVVVKEDEVKEESKMKGFFRNNWKKLAVGAGVVLAGVGGFILGSNTGNDDELEFIDLDDETDSEEETTSE